MQINNILAGYHDPTTVSRRSESGETSAATTDATAKTSSTSSANGNAALGEILSQYDVTNITPLEFSDMIHQLFNQGVIDENELQQLVAIRQDLDAAGVDNDEPVNLLEFYEERIEELQELREDDELPNADQQIAPLLRRLDWVEKFAVIQSAPDAAGINAVA